MTFSRPTLSELVTRTRADFRSRLGIAGSLLRRNMSNVMAVVWSGVAHEMHGHLSWATKQVFGDTAERAFLLRLAAKYGLTLTPAAFAAGTVLATGVNGSVILVDTIYVRDDGATFRVTTESTISGGDISVPVQAVIAGADGNMPSGDTLSLESPVTGVDTDATVESGGIIDGLDEEDIEDFRVRYLLRRREPPSGGGDQDYEAWALAVAGVTRAWVARHEDGLGTVKVRFVLDGEVDIFPDAEKVAEVQTAIDAKRPTTSEPTAAAPTQLDVDFTIALANDTTAIRDAVEAELEDLVRRVGEPGNGAGVGQVLLSEMRTAVGNASEGDYTMTVPSANVVPATGALPVFGTVTWA